MGVIADILGVVDGAVSGVAESGFGQVAASVGNVITAGSILLVVLLGINIVMQVRPMTMGSFFTFGLRIVLVGMFAQSWASFGVIYQIITDVPDSIGASIVRLTGVSTTGGLYDALDSMVAQVTAYGDTIGDNAGWVFGAVLGVVVWLVAAIFAAIAAGIIAYSKIILTLMVVFAPIAIICSLFKPTQALFDAWSRSIIGYAFMPVAAAGAAGIVIAVAGQIAGSSPDPDNVDTLSLIFPFIVVLILAAGIMMAVPSIAMGLSGAIGIASNAAGLTGLAKSGVAGGGSAAMRVATGVLPRAAMQGLNNGLEAPGRSLTSVVRSSPAKILSATNALRGK